MKPFKDNRLGMILDGYNKRIQDRIDYITDDQLLANDIEILAENLFQEHYIVPVIIGDEDVLKRTIK